MKTTMRMGSLAVLVFACGCAGTGDNAGNNNAGTLTYAGLYRVPVSAALAPAATFAMDEIDVTRSNGVLTVDYALPPGLVGGNVRVNLSGPLDATGAAATLNAGDGSGSCTLTATRVVCNEAFVGLGALPVSMAEVERLAALEFTGAVADRVSVATTFGSDPIGILEIDLTTPGGEPLDDGTHQSGKTK